MHYIVCAETKQKSVGQVTDRNPSPTVPNSILSSIWIVLVSVTCVQSCRSASMSNFPMADASRLTIGFSRKRTHEPFRQLRRSIRGDALTSGHNVAVIIITVVTIPVFFICAQVIAKVLRRYSSGHNRRHVHALQNASLLPFNASLLPLKLKVFLLGGGDMVSRLASEGERDGSSKVCRLPIGLVMAVVLAAMFSRLEEIVRLTGLGMKSKTRNCP